jgi:hypothetical protein
MVLTDPLNDIEGGASRGKDEACSSWMDTPQRGCFLYEKMYHKT